MKRYVIALCLALVILPGCKILTLNDFESFKEVEIVYLDEFYQGNDQGYKDAKASMNDHLDTLYPLKESYSQYDLGYIDGYYVGCHERSVANCDNVDELVQQILDDESGKYDIKTERKETIIK